MPNRETLLDSLPAPVMLTVAGKRFACECGANVFTKRDGIYLCHGCDRRYSGE